jgi:hypothetical protein
MGVTRWHNPGCTGIGTGVHGRDRGVANKLGVLVGGDSIVSDIAGVWDMGGVKTMHVSGLYGASWGAGAVLVALVMWPVVVRLWLVFQRGPEQGIQPSSMNTLLIMWQIQ